MSIAALTQRDDNHNRSLKPVESNPQASLCHANLQPARNLSRTNPVDRIATSRIAPDAPTPAP